MTWAEYLASPEYAATSRGDARVHRNARWILEAANLTQPGERYYFIEDDSLFVSANSVKLALETISRDTARTILRGILAPRFVAELRRLAERGRGNAFYGSLLFNAYEAVSDCMDDLEEINE